MADVDVWELAERLDAAALDAQAHHHDLCGLFDERGSQPCSCGDPQLFIDAAAFVRGLLVEQAITRARQAA